MFCGLLVQDTNAASMK
jgi:hypothetical protein